MCDRKALPSPAPSLAPRTSPAMSVHQRYAGYSLLGFHTLMRSSYRASGTEQRASVGSIVQNG